MNEPIRCVHTNNLCVILFTGGGGEFGLLPRGGGLHWGGVWIQGVGSDFRMEGVCIQGGGSLHPEGGVCKGGGGFGHMDPLVRYHGIRSTSVWYRILLECILVSRQCFELWVIIMSFKARLFGKKGCNHRFLLNIESDSDQYNTVCITYVNGLCKLQ